MLKRIEPLRNELKSLENAASDNRTKNDEMQNVIQELEKSIAKYKEEYAVLISQAQAIKADLAAVEAKVRHTMDLVEFSIKLINIVVRFSSSWLMSNRMLRKFFSSDLLGLL